MPEEIFFFLFLGNETTKKKVDANFSFWITEKKGQQKYVILSDKMLFLVILYRLHQQYEPFCFDEVIQPKY